MQKFDLLSITLFLAFASTVASAAKVRVRQAPSCAMKCFTTADLGGCKPTDNSCLCHSITFKNSVTSCIYSECEEGDVESSLELIRQICAIAAS